MTTRRPGSLAEPVAPQWRIDSGWKRVLRDLHQAKLEITPLHQFCIVADGAPSIRCLLSTACGCHEFERRDQTRASGQSVRKRSFARHSGLGRQHRARKGQVCNACRVRGNVKLSAVCDTLCRMRIGYGRVSTRDQHLEAQHDALQAAACEPVIDKASGKLARRAELDKALLSANRSGDQLVVTKLDRLGRSPEHLIEMSKLLESRGVDLVVLDQGIDSSTAVGKMFFHILGAIAEFEHALMSERTMDGLAAARARGRTGGQKPKLGPRQVRLAREMYDETGEDGKRRHTVAQIAAEFGVSRPTIYRHLAAAQRSDAA